MVMYDLSASTQRTITDVVKDDDDDDDGNVV